MSKHERKVPDICGAEGAEVIELLVVVGDELGGDRVIDLVKDISLRNMKSIHSSYECKK